jgi:3-hydroxybutyryl-CoA dehydrogenase
MAIRSIGVVGCGLMGSGIAQVSAQAGFPTTVREVSDEALGAGLRSIRRFLERGVEKGKLAPAEVERALGNLKGTVDLRDLAGCDLVVEAVNEDFAMKRDVLGSLDAIVAPGAILASNTSSLSITALAAATRRPERLLGLHFFTPVPLLGLVELVRGLRTSDETARAAADWCRAIGKTVVDVRDSAGFVVNRLLVPYVLDAIRALEQGLASRDDIDRAMTLGCGHPMGPLLLADHVGLDTLHAAAEAMFRDLREARFAPPPLLTRMLASGLRGRKGGRGFYDWSTDPPS